MSEPKHISDILNDLSMDFMELPIRKIKDWMLLDQIEIDNLTESDWNHYKDGGCLCFAHSDSECICGSWSVD